MHNMFDLVLSDLTRDLVQLGRLSARGRGDGMSITPCHNRAPHLRSGTYIWTSGEGIVEGGESQTDVQDLNTLEFADESDDLLRLVLVTYGSFHFPCWEPIAVA